MLTATEHASATRIAVAAALFSFSAGPIGIVVQKWLVASFSPFLIVAVQMTGGALMLWAIRYLAFPRVSVPRSAILKGLALGALHPGSFMIVYISASDRLDSVTAVLLIALMPALVAISGRIILKETLRPIVFVGITISLLGLVILVSERQITGANEPTGFLLGGLGLILASGSVIAGRAINTNSVLPWFLLAPLQVSAAAIVAWTGVLAMGARVDFGPILQNAGAFAYLAFGMTGASYLAYNYALSRLQTPVLGLLSAAGPGVGALAAAIIFATTIAPVAIIGIVVILIGTAMPPIYGMLIQRDFKVKDVR